MNYYLFGAGVLLLIVTATDLIKTALSASGAGMISKRLSKTIWNILLFLKRVTRAKRLLEKGGAIILVCILMNWLLLLWTSTSLMFISEPASLMNVETNTSTSIISKIFYTGYTLSTLGLGDIEPDGAFWDVLTAIMSFAGLVLISIAITYLIPVVSAEVEKRRISVYITTMGCSIHEILKNYWNGEDFKEMEEPMRHLTPMIILHAQNHKAYSVLHYFHTSEKKEAFTLNITNLDEVLTVLMYHIPESNRPAWNVLIGLRKAISSYLITLPSSYITPGADIPPVISLSQLQEQGIEVSTEETVNTAYENLTSRRRLLLSLIRDDGWQWEDLEAGEYDHVISIIAK